jgi:hypothetical protein
VLWSACGMEEGTTDWNSRTEQRERPERDRLMARDDGICFGLLR